MKKKFPQIPLFLSIFILSCYSCKKQPGPGGTSYINGKVYAQYYDKTFYSLVKSEYAPNIDVYIIYGDNIAYGSHQKTSYDGSYEFKYLESGTYKVYTYSRDSTGKYNGTVNKYSPNVTVLKTVEITKSHQTVVVPDLNIFK
jgi:hypothetical protein